MSVPLYVMLYCYAGISLRQSSVPAKRLPLTICQYAFMIRPISRLESVGDNHPFAKKLEVPAKKAARFIIKIGYYKRSKLNTVIVQCTLYYILYFFTTLHLSHHAYGEGDCLDVFVGWSMMRQLVSLLVNNQAIIMSLSNTAYI